MSAFHPDLALARFIPKTSYGPRLLPLMRKLTVPPVSPGEDVTVETIEVPGAAGGPPVELTVFRPTGAMALMPVLFWIHGGGFIFGSPAQDDRTNILFARELGITVVAVKYRLSPESTAPDALDDVYAGLTGMIALADRLGIDIHRIAIGGASAGGGLAAALALACHDRGEIEPLFQLLLYPMIDDRTATRTDVDGRNMRGWSPKSNVFAWTSYLGHAPGGEGVDAYAAPSRRADLRGLPPAWIGVGTLDLFHDEDVEYARRLNAAGVPCELSIIPGAFHGSDAMFSKSRISRTFWHQQADALRAGLGIL